MLGLRWSLNTLPPVTDGPCQRHRQWPATGPPPVDDAETEERVATIPCAPGTPASVSSEFSDYAIVLVIVDQRTMFSPSHQR